MKKKSWYLALVAALVAFTCAFTVACGGNTDNEPENPENPALVALTVSLDQTSGAVSFSPAVDGASKYEIVVLRYQSDPVTYTATASPYVVSPIEAGDVRITVRALGEEDKELGSGSVAVTLTRNIGMPQSVEGVAINGDMLVWTAEESSVSYTLEAVKAGEVKATKSGLTDLSYDLSSLNLGAGKHEIRVYGVNQAGVKGTAGKSDYISIGDSDFMAERAEGEKYIANFRKADAREFAENHGSTLKADSETLEYTDGMWEEKGVWYTLPRPIEWNTVLQIKMRVRVTGAGSAGCYAYLFNEKNVDQGVYPGQSWQGFGTESLTDDGDGWKITTFSAELIRRQTMNDSYWADGEAEYLAHIFFGATGSSANIEVDYVTYTERTAADEFSLTYKGEEMADEYRTVDKFDWTRLGITGNYDVDYRLEKDGVPVEFETEHYLGAGDYRLIAKVRGEYYGKAVKEFTVVSSDLPVPAGITDLVYEGTTLSWTAAENAASYRIVAKKLDGTIIDGTATAVTGTSAEISLPAGKVNVIVTSVSADGVEGRDVLTQVVSLGNTGYMQPVSVGSDELVIASFDSTDYDGFLSAGEGKSYEIKDGELVGKTSETSWSVPVVEYELPFGLKDEKIYEIAVRFKGKLVVQFVNQNDEVVDAIVYAGGWYGITGEADGDYTIARFTFDSILKCPATVAANKPDATAGEKNDLHYKWTAEKNEVTKIRLLCVNSPDDGITVDYIRLTKTVDVAESDISVLYDGGAVAAEYTTATDFDWTKFTADGYEARFTLTADGEEIEKTTRLVEGDYVLTATLTGKYVGSKSVSFTVNAVVIPDEISELAFDSANKKLTWKKANGAETYAVTAKTKAGAAVTLDLGAFTTEGETVSVAINGDLPAGYLTFAVQSVSVDDIKAAAVELDVTVLGNTNFGAVKEEGSMYTYIANFNHADYAAFATAGKNVTSIEGTADGLIVQGAENEWNETIVDIPVDIDVENKDFVVMFTFAPIKDNVTAVTVNLYNEEGKSAYSYFSVNNIWVSAYTEGGVSKVAGSQIGSKYDYNNCQIALSLSAAKFAADKDCAWTNKKAKKITKIAISYKTVDGKLPIKDIVVYDDMISKFTSGTTVAVGEAQGTTVFDVKDNVNVTYNEYSVNNGVLEYSSSKAWATFATYTLPEAVSIGESSVIKLRIKGCAYITLKDADGNAVCDQIKWHDGWWDGTNYTTEVDGEYRIVTVAADKISKKTSIKTVVISCAEAKNKGYVDYIAVVG